MSLIVRFSHTITGFVRGFRRTRGDSPYSCEDLRAMGAVPLYAGRLQSRAE